MVIRPSPKRKTRVRFLYPLPMCYNHRMSQAKKFSILRIVFGLIWAIDAYFKWQPAFFANFTTYLSGNLSDQPAFIHYWIDLWIHLVGVQPHFFALVVALAETAIAIGLIIGFLTRGALIGGMIMSIVIWSTAESFGGPYIAGSTDIGAALIYVLVFVALYLGHCWEGISLDALLKKKGYL